MRRILTEKEMQDARKSVRFCYLCGKTLPPRDQPGRRKLVRTEHVIPRALLGKPPPKGDQFWPITLDVHATCDDRYKRRTDDLAALLHYINANPSERWPDRKHIQRLGLNLLRLEGPLTGLSIPAFGNAQKALSAAWVWVRGLHAALYGEYLPANVKQRTLPPVPAFDKDAGPAGFNEFESLSEAIRGLVDGVAQQGGGDEICAWGGQVRYLCAWGTLASRDHGHDCACLWELVFPGVQEWSATVLAAPLQRPWHGCYCPDHLPAEATVLELPKRRMRVEPL